MEIKDWLYLGIMGVQVLGIVLIKFNDLRHLTKQMTTLVKFQHNLMQRVSRIEGKLGIEDIDME